MVSLLKNLNEEEIIGIYRELDWAGINEIVLKSLYEIGGANKVLWLITRMTGSSELILSVMFSSLKILAYNKKNSVVVNEIIEHCLNIWKENPAKFSSNIPDKERDLIVKMIEIDLQIKVLDFLLSVPIKGEEGEDIRCLKRNLAYNLIDANILKRTVAKSVLFNTNIWKFLEKMEVKKNKPGIRINMLYRGH